MEIFDRYIIKTWETFDEISNNLYLAGKLNVCCSPTFLIPKICKCDLQELNIVGITLGFEEFKFLVKSDFLETFLIHNVIIEYSNKIVVQLEDIFAELPNVTSFTYRHAFHTFDESTNSKTFYQMAHTCRNRKIFTIDLQGIDNDAGPSDVVLFLQNYAADHCRIVLNIKPNYTLRSIFRSMVNQMRLK
uniref:DUF38 domain-containing protein n=1 Tax=Panagrolaimus davidi TaxID=227884 RepID=A0A914QCL1_9BILA